MQKTGRRASPQTRPAFPDSRQAVLPQIGMEGEGKLLGGVQVYPNVPFHGVPLNGAPFNGVPFNGALYITVRHLSVCHLRVHHLMVRYI